jgi:hypothetical protein
MKMDEPRQEDASAKYGSGNNLALSFSPIKHGKQCKGGKHMDKLKGINVDTESRSDRSAPPSSLHQKYTCEKHDRQPQRSVLRYFVKGYGAANRRLAVQHPRQRDRSDHAGAQEPVAHANSDE